LSPSLFTSAAVLVALSWARLAIKRHPSPDHGPFTFPLDAIAACVFVAAVLVALRAHRGRTAHAAARPGALGPPAREAAAIALVAGAMLPLVSGDLFSGLAYAELASRGADPFRLAERGLLASSFFPYVSPAWRDAPCVYGPLQLLVWAPAARLGASLAAAVAAAKLIAVVAALLTIVLLRWYCERPGGPGAALFGAAVLAPAFWFEAAGQAHNDVVVGLLFAAWLLAARGRRSVLAAAFLGAAVASKLTAALPAGMYLAYLAGRPGAWPARAGRTGAALLALAGVVVLAYLPFWAGSETLSVPLAYLAERRPTNSIGEIAFVALRPLLGAATAADAVSLLGTLLTGGLALLGAALAFRASDHASLAGTMAAVSLLASSLASPVFHPWYLIPSLVLSVELRDPAWQAWLAAFGGLSLLVDGSVLFAYGSAQREAYTIVSVGVVALASVWRLGPRLRGLVAPLARSGA
jgi:alpha-1,6-mannosyltransferase